jgi:hypothetical protein
MHSLVGWDRMIALALTKAPPNSPSRRTRKSSTHSV